MRTLIKALVLLTAFCGLGGTARAQEVDLLLVLAFDCSYSVDASEFALQRDGMASAFRHPEVLEAIANGPNGRIAVAVVQWSSWESQVLAVPWTLVGDEASAAALSGRIAGMTRQTSDGATSISGALYYSAQLFAASPFLGFRKTVDVSGDGRNNNGPPLPTARDLTVAQGITVNGLAILNEVPTLHFYYQQQLAGGGGSFVEVANDYADYPEAIRRKLIREISLMPLAGLPPGAPGAQLSERVSAPR